MRVVTIEPRNQTTLMKKSLLALLVAGAVLLTGTHISQATLFDIDLSPAGGTALNLGLPSTHYFGDHAVGLAGPNEPFATPATGNEIGVGITFDSVSKVLSFHIGYGAAFGFTSLLGSYTDAHLHGPSLVAPPAPNTPAGVIIPMGGFHTPSTPTSGSFSGSVLLSAAHEGMLFDNLIYLNIHSTASPGGEIRAQLIVVPEPSVAGLLALGMLALFRARRR